MNVPAPSQPSHRDGSPSSSIQTSPTRLESIDALRGLAFLGVLLVHVGQAIPAFTGKSLTVFGGFGVALFFIASAYTLMASHHQRIGRDAFPLKSFLIRRVTRILPLFWAGIAFYFVIYGTWNRGWAEGSLTPTHFALTASLLHGFHPDTINTVVPGGWSIAAEFGFYLLCPLLFLIITNRRRALLAFAIATTGAVTLNYFARREIGPLAHLFPDVPLWRRNALTYFWLPSHLPTFALGFVAYYTVGTFSRIQPHLTRIALALITAALLASALWMPLAAADYLLPVLLTALVIALIAYPNAILVNRVTRTLGTLSFSAYIIHFAAIKVAESILHRVSLPFPELQFVALFTCALLITASAAFATYRLIELPGINLGRKWIASLT